MARTKIEWTESTWNPITGCTKISSGCKNCYAEVMTRRLKAMGQEKYQNGFNLSLHPETLKEPYTWKKPRVIFVNSMSDLFHKDIPVQYIIDVFRVMKDNPHHVFQILTKRADLLLYYDKEELLEWTHNIWMGVTVEDNTVTKRIDLLRQTGAKIKFLSCEPLLTGLPELNLKDIDWRHIKEEWVINIKEQCQKANVAFYFKQWGGTNKKKNGKSLQGKQYTEMPEVKQLV
jgi:protein gp37